MPPNTPTPDEIAKAQAVAQGIADKLCFEDTWEKNLQGDYQWAVREVARRIATALAEARTDAKRETWRLATSVDPLSVACPQCEASPSVFCAELGRCATTGHRSRWRRALRAARDADLEGSEG